MGNFILILILYVDGILISSNCIIKLEEIINALKLRFKMTYLRELRSFLGIEIIKERINKTITLSLEKFITKLLKNFSFSKMHPQKTPMVTNQVPNRNIPNGEDDETMNSEITLENHNCRAKVGSPQYLAITLRPDIFYAANVLSRHQVNPTREEWKMANCVFRCLNYTKKDGLKFEGKLNNLEGYCDASLADCKGSLTPSGYIIRLFPYYVRG